ncbi:NAD(P)-binding protein [Parathielavia appendiculata]|uniref:NAD(P)-binding protein n=1 Tax=Parathielavia appendiculata TaxID=2587402 RepID=A0AAN6YZ45_9PEZI|nr:NAD(P)-binding protein [Parathielavia appendiculata]
MGFLYSQLIESWRLPYPNTNYAGQTIVITGSNTGLGKEAARHYARLGASKLILAARNVDKGEAAKQDILTTAAKGVSIEVWQVDMASYVSVKAFAARIESELDRIDIFHANAGLVRAEFAMAEDNETGITVNYVSTFLLVALVLPKLRSTAEQFKTRPSLVITSSGAHRHTTFPQMEEVNILAAVNDRNYAGGRYWRDRYPISKLLGIFAVRSIAKEHPADTYPVTINLVSPGLCHSGLSREAKGMQKIMFTGMKMLLARSTENGSRTLVDAGVQGPESHGQYLEDCKIAEPSEVVTQNPDVQDRLWVELKAKLEGIQPGVTANF